MRKVSIVDSQVFGLIPKNSKSKSIANFIQRLALLNSAVNPIIYCMVSANNSYIWKGGKIRGRTDRVTVSILELLIAAKNVDNGGLAKIVNELQRLVLFHLISPKLFTT